MADFILKSNIIHWFLIKCKRITRFILINELYGITISFNNGFAFNTILNKIIKAFSTFIIPIVMYTDFKSLYECLIKLGNTIKKRLIINIILFRKSYKRREIAEIR